MTSRSDLAAVHHEKKRKLQSDVGVACRLVAQVFDTNTRLMADPIPVIPEKDVEIGAYLGHGGFNDVYEVTAKVVQRNGSEQEEVWAVKRLRPSIMASKSHFGGGAFDLVLEAKLLNALRHTNIIRLHGVSCDDDSLKCSYLDDNQYCLYLDRLYGTVDEKFDAWRKRYAPLGKRDDLLNRIETIALPIAEAMEYLHSQNVIFRDLKPSNMGFDIEGNVKLFDFGLAREIPHNSDRRLTGATGSRRYMAPEVALSMQYGLPADVYSFGIFLYEASTLERPFHSMTRSEHEEKVTRGRFRPSFYNYGTIPRSLQKLVRRCWDHSPKVRPDFRSITEQLRLDIASMKVDKKTKQSQGPLAPLQNMFRPPWSPSRHRATGTLNACAA